MLVGEFVCLLVNVLYVEALHTQNLVLVYFSISKVVDDVGERFVNVAEVIHSCTSYEYAPV